MNISDLVPALLLCRDANITSFTWGNKGVGKSDSHREIALANNWGFIDLRGSQMEASDLRGLPIPDNGMTRYLPPSDLPRGHATGKPCPACSDMTYAEAAKAGMVDRDYCKGVLFLDEVNRSEDDVLQAIFQLVLDKAIGEYRVPPGWSIHCAGNFSKGDYSVNSFKDAALLDRFCHLTISTGGKYVASWVEWMTNEFPEADRIVQFIGGNEEHLTGKVKGELGFDITPSPRSWALVARVERACALNEYEPEIKREVISGVVGNALALSYERFSCEVTPKQILENGPAPYEAKLAGLTRNALIGLAHGVSSKCKNLEEAARTQKVMHNVCEFILFLCNAGGDRDLAVALARMLMGQESPKLGGAILTNPKLAAVAQRIAKTKGMANPQGWISTLLNYPGLQEVVQRVSWGTPAAPAPKAVNLDAFTRYTNDETR